MNNQLLNNDFMSNLRIFVNFEGIVVFMAFSIILIACKDVRGEERFSATGFWASLSSVIYSFYIHSTFSMCIWLVNTTLIKWISIFDHLGDRKVKINE